MLEKSPHHCPNSILISSDLSQVVHRPTEGLCRVLKWAPDDSIMLLKPINIHRTKSGGTRWAFEKDVVLIETRAKTTASSTKGAASQIPSNSNGSALQTAQKEAVPMTTMSAVDAEDPTTFASRTGKLNRRFVIRRDSQRANRGRGVFAVKDVPKGTEVMRVRAVAAVVKNKARENMCCMCFRNIGQVGGTLSTCSTCSYGFCRECRSSVARRQGNAAHTRTCSFVASVDSNPVGMADPELLRLTADCLVRKKSDQINDEEWEVMNTLEGQNTGASGGWELEAGTLRDARLRLEALVGFDVSEEDVQTVYCRHE